MPSMAMSLSGDQSLGAEEPILHIEVHKWSDLLVISPLDANTLAKVVNGICDNPLTSMVRAWNTDGTINGKEKSIVVAQP